MMLCFGIMAGARCDDAAELKPAATLEAQRYAVKEYFPLADFSGEAYVRHAPLIEA
jgi:hypothetical protein